MLEQGAFHGGVAGFTNWLLKQPVRWFGAMLSLTRDRFTKSL
jgi:hypothetical protein